VLPVLPIGCASRQKSLLDRGGYGGVRKKGLLKLEGKEYIVKDGDVLVIRHG
jgi:ribosome-binding ATPase YchF (GTP1/OBG family)